MNDILIYTSIDKNMLDDLLEIVQWSDLKSNTLVYFSNTIFKSKVQVEIESIAVTTDEGLQNIMEDLYPMAYDCVDLLKLDSSRIEKIYIDCLLLTNSLVIQLKICEFKETYV